MTIIIKSDVSFDNDALVFDLAEPFTRHFGSDLYAAYYLGSGFDEAVNHDYSGNGRSLTNYGSPTIAEKYVDCTNANGFNTGFTGTELADGGPITCIGVIRQIASPQLGRVFTAGNSSSNDDNVGLSWAATYVRASIRKGTTIYSADKPPNTDAVTQNEMIAMVATTSQLRSFQRSTNFTISSSAPTTIPASATSPLSILLGATRTTGGSTTASRLICAAFARGDYSGSLETLYQRLSVYLARRDVDL